MDSNGQTKIMNNLTVVKIQHISKFFNKQLLKEKT